METVEVSDLNIPNDQMMLELTETQEEHLCNEILTSPSTTTTPTKRSQKTNQNNETTTRSSAKKRTSVTIEKKIEIIRRHEKGESQKELAAAYNLGRTTVSDILKNKTKYFKYMSMNENKEDNMKRRRNMRKTIHKDMEDKLCDWYKELRAQGEYVNGPMLAAKAQELYKELEYSGSFTASNGWLDRFKLRNGIKLSGLREINMKTDTSAVEPFKQEFQQTLLWYNLTPEHVYNADETDLFWKLAPNPESDTNEVAASVRVYRERMTVLCCSNATGSHKLPLVCVGRGKKTRIFTSTEMKSLPVNYYAQEHAWMDQEIFKNWFHNFFVPSVKIHLRNQQLPEVAVLLIDRSPSHPVDDHTLRSEDGSIFCQYFPSEVKSLVQPMEQGVFANMKKFYRREFLIEALNSGVSLSEFQKKIVIKDSIMWIANGWDLVSDSVIKKSFAKILTCHEQNLTNLRDDVSISIESFESLIRQFPECSKYPTKRILKWLNCDEVEQQQSGGRISEPEIDDSIQKLDETFDSQHDNVVFVDFPSGDITYEIVKNENNIENITIGLIEQNSDEEFIEEHPQIQEIDQQSQETFEYEEEPGAISCKQASDALNVLLQFMKKDPESLYRDVTMLEELQKKLHNRMLSK